MDMSLPIKPSAPSILSNMQRTRKDGLPGARGDRQKIAALKLEAMGIEIDV